MNVGTWILSAYAPLVGLAALSQLTGVGRSVGRVAAWSAAALAPALATYTAVLTADTVVPAWHHARAELPALYAHAVDAYCTGEPRHCNRGGAARRLAVGGAASEWRSPR
jgi:hypothetical protein